MLYLNEKNIEEIGMPWNTLIKSLEQAVRILATGDFAQPIKPYLRYRDPQNRIIAMPAYVGGKVDIAGIKWIASFPDNISRGIPRAHSVIILNEAATGIPLGILNTPLVSIIRTSTVSGLIAGYYFAARSQTGFNLSIIGWGPIGQFHFRLFMELYGEIIDTVHIYDLREIDPSTIAQEYRKKTIIARSWQEAYGNADIFITCTVSSAPYIDTNPKAGSLQLNVSLRDYTTSIFEYVKDAIIVDDWDEVCRQNTDIENLHKYRGLRKEDTRSIIDVVTGDCMQNYPLQQAIMFNPMGMAVFDVTIASYYYQVAKEQGIGTEL